MNRTESEEYIIGIIFLLANKLNQFGDRILDDITFKQFMLLIILSKMEESEKNINNIAANFGSTRQNVKKMLSSLEIKGYVSITKSKHDARALVVDLTEQAYLYFSEHVAATSKEADALFHTFSDQKLYEFTQKLDSLLQCLETYGERINEDE